MSFFGGDETVTPPWMDSSAFNGSDEQKASFNIPDDLPKEYEYEHKQSVTAHKVVSVSEIQSEVTAS